MARRNPVDVRIGAHVAGGLKGGVEHAVQIGAGPIQIFIGSPRTWREPTPKPIEIETFRKDVLQHNLGPVFVHASYLVNLAAGDPSILERSIIALRAQLRLAELAGACGVIFHPGSAGTAAPEEALASVVRSIEQVLAGHDGRCRLVLEVCAGQGETIGDRFGEFAAILDAFGRDRRLAVCWDTCHLHASGYDIKTKEGLDRTLDEFESEVGMEWLVAIHANDSKSAFGSRVDRHENIGKGHLGEEPFTRMLHHPQLRPRPWILEVPGFDGNGPDRENVDILKRLAA
jgi:deoxyribonuclease-4